MSIKQQVYNKPVFILCFALFISIFFHPWTDTYTRSLISWDKLGYYLYLPSLFIYKDWHLFTFEIDYFIKYQPSDTWYQTLFLPDKVNQVITYSIGLSFFQLPFFLLGHFSAYLLHYPMDGFSTPYVFWIFVSGLFFCLAGLYLCYKCLINFFSVNFSWWIVIIILLSTNLVFYGMVDTIMPHSYLFFLFSLLLYSTIKWHEKPNFKFTILICLSIGLMISIRVTDGIAVLIPLLYGINVKGGLKNKIIQLRNNFGKVIISIMIACIPFLTQMYYWHMATGSWLFNPYGYTYLGFSWTHPHLIDFLFSFKKGWFLYTPVMLISIAGFFYMKKTKANLLLPGIVIFLLANIYILSSWDIWFFGGSYGQRSMIQSYALLAIPFAAALESFNKNKLMRLGSLIFISACLIINLLNVWLYKSDLMLTNGMTYNMCKENLLHPFAAFIPESKRVDRYTWKDEYVEESDILYNDSSTKTIKNGEFAELGNWSGEEIMHKPFQWVRCTFDGQFLSGADNLPFALITVNEVKKPNDVVAHWKGKFFTDQFEKKGVLSNWVHRTIDFRIPLTLHENERYKLYFWLPQEQIVYIKNIKFYGIKIKS